MNEKKFNELCASIKGNNIEKDIKAAVLGMCELACNDGNWQAPNQLLAALASKPALRASYMPIIKRLNPYPFDKRTGKVKKGAKISSVKRTKLMDENDTSNYYKELFDQFLASLEDKASKAPEFDENKWYAMIVSKLKSGLEHDVDVKAVVAKAISEAELAVAENEEVEESEEENQALEATVS